MYLLYFLFSVMIIGAVGIIAIPFINSQKTISANLCKTVLCMISFIALVFAGTGGTHQLSEWLNGPKQHYQLLTEVQALGGIDGMISRLSQKTKAHPNDAQAWFILGKLYLVKQDSALAFDAFQKAKNLDPANPEIDKYYRAAKESS